MRMQIETDIGRRGVLGVAIESGRRPSRPVVLLLAIAFLCVAGVLAVSTANARPTAANTTLVVGGVQEPPTWDYTANANTGIDSLLLYNVLEPLLEKNKDGSLKPLLARSYKVSDGGRTYTFALRQATFQNGHRLSAGDVVYSLRRNEAAVLADVSAPLKVVRSVRAIGDLAVKVTLSRPSQGFLDSLSGPSGIIIPKGGGRALAHAPVGTGPFTFVRWRNGVDVTLSRYAGYWGRKPYFSSVKWRFIPEAAALNALQAGGIDLDPTVYGYDHAKQIAANSRFRIVESPAAELEYLALNAKDPAFQDPRVRYAIAYATDRKAIVDGIGGPALYTPTCLADNPLTVPWRSNYCPYPYNPDRARQLLAQAGATGMTLNFTYVPAYSSAQINIAQLQAVGFKVQTTTLDFAPYIDQVLGKAQYQLTLISGPQPLDSFTCPGWFVQDCSTGFDNLLARADAAPTHAKWAALRGQAMKLQADRAYRIPIWVGTNLALMKASLAGVKPFAVASEVDLRGLYFKG